MFPSIGIAPSTPNIHFNSILTRHYNFNSINYIDNNFPGRSWTYNRSVRDDSPEVLVFYHWMLSQDLHLIHFYHSLNKAFFTAVTFSQDAAPLILLSTGEDSAKETPFFTSWMNLMQFIYIYYPAYLSIRLA